MVHDPEQIKGWIEGGLPCEHVEVRGDGHHFEAVIVSPAFRGKSRVQQHQLVYAALGEPHARGDPRAVHADLRTRGLGREGLRRHWPRNHTETYGINNHDETIKLR